MVMKKLLISLSQVIYLMNKMALTIYFVFYFKGGKNVVQLIPKQESIKVKNEEALEESLGACCAQSCVADLENRRSFQGMEEESICLKSSFSVIFYCWEAGSRESIPKL